MRYKIDQWLRFRIFHLGPNRFYPATFYDESNKDNSEIFNVIKAFQKNKPIPGGKKDRFFKKWLKTFNIADDVEIDAEYSPNLFFIDYKIKTKTLKTTELGYGSGQLLTILLNIAGLKISDPDPKSKDFFNGMIVELMNPGKKILVIEEPESNLHPHFQALLAEMLYEAAITFNLTIIVEIHSEYMIRRLMKLVAAKTWAHDDLDANINYPLASINKVTSENLILYYLNANSDWSIIDKIEFMDDGRLSENLSEEFMGVAANDTLESYKFRNNLNKEI